MKKVLWRIYVNGRFGEIKTLGFVIASGHDMDWIRRSYNIACNIVRKIK